MIQEDFETWEQFENKIQQLQSPSTENGESGNEPHLLFRGQADQSWGLETTLDRTNKGEWSFAEYFRLILVTKTQVETFTDNRWEIEGLSQLRNWAFKYDNLVSSPFPAYDFLVFLRHHGFPSPLLDWTRSPYVAAFFAFAQPKAERVAVYVYQEHAGWGKLSSSDEPLICSFGPNVRSHSRHFLQQSEYTIGANFSKGEWVYTLHEEVFANNSTKQDLLWKFTIPTSERVKTLKALDAHNLNEFSLFQTTEALLNTISCRELEIKKSTFNK
jgi:hypothetical protein